MELAALLDSHLAAKRGVSGMAMKLAYSTVRSAKPDLPQRAVRSLLPELLAAVDPLHAELQKRPGTDLAALLLQHKRELGAALLARLDARLARSQNATGKALYQRFRSSAGDELQAVLPALAKTLARHLR